MPASYSSIVEKITSRISAIENIGNVYDFRLYVDKSDDFKTKAYDDTNDRWLCWTVTREAVPDKEFTTMRNQRNHIFVIRGYMGLDEFGETDKTFQALIHDIMEAFRPQDNLDELVEKHFPVQARTIFYAWWGAKLCHYCELTLEVQELYIKGLVEV